LLTLGFLGRSLLLLAIAGSALQFLLPVMGLWKKKAALSALVRPLALLQCFFVANAFLLLVLAFLTNDFSLAYVAQNSQPALPFMYRLTAVWGAHEGSFLLWIFLLDLWTVALCFGSRSWPKSMSVPSLAILGLLSGCFLVFLSATSNPFLLGFDPTPRDLNPLLQDPGFFLHPPFLYAGYVGFSVVFAITVAYLLQREPLNWARLVRPWVIAAWSFLTVGITLGSWWAYRVLGWGGFWFWDPVENASLLPWLTGIALIHLLLVVEKQKRFNDWAIILALISFSLSILGTFLVRSGVLVSVHSFATDPSRGLFLLLLLALITGGALLLYFWHLLKGQSPKGPNASLLVLVLS